MVVIGKGVLPAVSFIPRDRIKADLGIMVNPNMETNVPGIFAAGDVAEHIDIARKTPWVNAIWPEAVIHVRVAGMNMAGRSFACIDAKRGNEKVQIQGVPVGFSDCRNNCDACSSFSAASLRFGLISNALE